MPSSATSQANVNLPATLWQVLLRGARGRCPRCDGDRLFHHFLKPVLRCENCDHDWSLQRADDFPAYVSILLTGHIVAPFIGLLVLTYSLSASTVFAILMPLALILLLAFLQPAKGAIIALQWWLGLHGFRRERPASAD